MVENVLPTSSECDLVLPDVVQRRQSSFLARKYSVGRGHAETSARTGSLK